MCFLCSSLFRETIQIDWHFLDGLKPPTRLCFLLNLLFWLQSFTSSTNDDHTRTNRTIAWLDQDGEMRSKCLGNGSIGHIGPYCGSCHNDFWNHLGTTVHVVSPLRIDCLEVLDSVYIYIYVYIYIIFYHIFDFMFTLQYMSSSFVDVGGDCWWFTILGLSFATGVWRVNHQHVFPGHVPPVARCCNLGGLSSSPTTMVAEFLKLEKTTSFMWIRLEFEATFPP